MATIAHICKNINQRFNKETVRQHDADGKNVAMKDTSGKIVRMLPAHCIYQGLPKTADLNMIDAKMDLIQAYLESEGGVVEIKTKMGMTVNFFNAKGKQSFSIQINRWDIKTFVSPKCKEFQVYFEFFHIVTQ